MLINTDSKIVRQWFHHCLHSSFKCFNMPVTAPGCSWVRDHPRPHRLGYLVQTLLSEQRKDDNSGQNPGHVQNQMKCDSKLTVDVFLEVETLGLLHPSDYVLGNKGTLEALYLEEWHCCFLLGVSLSCATPTATFSWYSSVAASLYSLRVDLLIDKFHLSPGPQSEVVLGQKEPGLL